MADDVSKKDLQALDRKLSKQVADLEKTVEDNRKKAVADADEVNQITVNVKRDHDEKIGELRKRCDDLQNGISTLARAIGDLAAKKADK